MGGFFGPTPAFDDFLGQYMTPAMNEAGFTRAKRVYRIQRGGAHVVVQARLYSPTPTVSFIVDWAAAPKVLIDFLKASRPSWRSSMNMAGMVHAQLSGATRLSGEISDSLFSFVDPAVQLPSGYEELVARKVPIGKFGPRFLDFLRTSAVPMWHRALTADYLRSAYGPDRDLDSPDNPGGFNAALRYGRPAAVAAILGVDTLPRDDAAAAIEQFPSPDDPIVPWLRARLAQRP